ncbi:sulfite exporter TauE/SafE family protein [Pedobacter sp. SYP-B3415]|uniref:sulfite exporter TauE/SafE family protein n=1 Tax=Pedobacter sp. SYP-B3415 TaxID=2496641 RepID=UPI00101CE8A8|nr:sulfite exporter TauE/SafE family protein [Pedobacter sp. SYP-B3415]
MDRLVIPLLLGFATSLHCVAMCGPLMLAFYRENRWLFGLKYQAGRISVYTLLGMAAGFFGSGFAVFTAQKNVAMVIGCLLLFFGTFNLAGLRFGKIQRLQAVAGSGLFKLLAPYQDSPGGPFLLGMLNGLIPCGMVYAALAAAINTGHPESGGQFMLFFGLGTLPLTLAAMRAGTLLRQKLKLNMPKLLPALTLLLGLLMLLRAADLGIPFLSPAHSSHPTHVSSCR